MFPGRTTRLTSRSAASAATLDADRDILILSGTTAIVTLVPKTLNKAYAQILGIIPTNAAGISTSAAGNIINVQAMIQNKITWFVWEPTTAKWYPHALA